MPRETDQDIIDGVVRTSIWDYIKCAGGWVRCDGVVVLNEELKAALDACDAVQLKLLARHDTN